MRFSSTLKLNIIQQKQIHIKTKLDTTRLTAWDNSVRYKEHHTSQFVAQYQKTKNRT